MCTDTTVNIDELPFSYNLNISYLALFCLSLLKTFKKERHSKAWATCTGIMTLGGLCFLGFALIGSEVDAEGILREPFFLIPMGFILLSTGGIGVVILQIMGFRKTQRQKQQ